MKMHFPIAGLLVGWLLFPLGAAAQLTITGMNIQQRDANAVRFQLEVTTSHPAGVYASITDGEAQHFTNISGTASRHHLSLMGMREETEYRVIVTAFDSLGAMDVEELTLTTGKLPEDVIHEFDTLVNLPGAAPGYVLANTRGAGITSQFRIFSRDGHLVWYDYMNLFGSPCIGYAYVPERRSILQPWGDCFRLYEITLEGDTLQKIDISELNQDLYIHHDAFINDLGHTVILIAEAETAVIDSVEKVVVADGYLEYDQEGNLVGSWSYFDHYAAEDATPLGAFWDPIFGEGSVDWTHANSLSQDTDGHYLMSLNALSQVIKINRHTGEIMWTLGVNGDFQIIPEDAVFRRQHFANGLGSNRYLLFDNLGGNTFSRASEFELDTVAMLARQVFVQDADSTLTTGIVGSASRLPNGNTLTCFGRMGALQEVDAEGNTVWYRGEGLFLNYRAYHVPDLYEPLPDFQLIDTALCSNAAPAVPAALPSGGYFSGPGIEAGLFNPASLEPGSYELTYHYGWASTAFSLQVAAAPDTPTIRLDGDWLIAEGTGPWQWFFEGSPIDGAGNDSLLIEAMGAYQVAITNAAGCSTLSAPINTTVTSTETIPEDQARIFPNPTSGPVRIDWEHELPATIEVLNGLGQVVESRQIRNNPFTIDLQAFPAGWYWLRYRWKDGRSGRVKVLKFDP